MKVYSDILTLDQVASQNVRPACTYVRAKSIERSRVRKRGWKIKLCSLTSNRHANSGTHGAATWEDDKPASWDEYGHWIANIFALDPNAQVGPYRSLADFTGKTNNAYQT